MPLPAGTGLDRRSFLSRSVGLAIAVYGASALSPQMFDAGIAQALAAGGSDTVLVSIFLDGGADSLSLLFPHGDPDYRRLRPQLALPDSGLVFPEDTRLRWHPSAASFHTLHGEGKLSVLPRGRLHECRSVALHVSALLGGRGHRRRPADRLARALPRPCRHDGQPSPGRQPRRRPLALARDREEARRGAERSRQLLVLGARRLGRGRGAHAERGRRARVDTRHATRHCGGEGRHLAVEPSAGTARALQHRRRIQQPRHLSDVGQRVPGSARRARGDDRGGPAAALRLSERVRHVRHAFRPGRHAARGAQADERHAARVPARPRGARPRQSCSHARLVRVRPARRGERVPEPTTAPPGSGC